jgi:glycerol-1-phosphate dehydrogenase [NAD(P)+]
MVSIEEALVKYVTADELRFQLELLKRVWPQLRERLSAQLVPFGEIQRCFGIVGAPTEPEQIGVTRQYLRDSFRRAQFIRRRFTVLDLAVRTGILDKWLDGIFGPRGVWNIDKQTKAL